MRERRTLDRVLSRAGVMSRKQAEIAIRGGRVRVNGLRVLDPATWVELPQDRITFDDMPLEGAQRVYIALHKPAGYVTTRSDERSRATVYELLDRAPEWIAPVGRLDRDTSGLLLFTNDTDWAERVTNPHTGLSKSYVCIASGDIGETQLEALRRGVELDDGPTRPARVERVGVEGGIMRLEISISEGRNRQVRRMLEAIGGRVVELHRTAIGAVELGQLPSGGWRRLAPWEIRALGKQFGPSDSA